MTANAIFFGARHGVGPPRHLVTSLGGATRLPKTLGRGRFGIEPTAIWGMLVHIAPRLSSPALCRSDAKGYLLPDIYSGATGIPAWILERGATGL
jgi:hypothetical protein